MKNITEIISKNKITRHNRRYFGILIILIVLFAALMFNKPILAGYETNQAAHQEQTTSPDSESIEAETPTPTPLPQEWIENSENTNDVVLVGVLLVVVVIGGTYRAIQQSRKARIDAEEE